MEVTASGVPRARRQEIKALVERLRGLYAGGLTVGQTAAVVVEGTPDWAQPKLAAAVANDIPVVSADWLEDSTLHGFLLCPARYRLLPGGAGRRSSAASTNAGMSAAPAASAPPPLAALAQPQTRLAALKALLEPSVQPPPAACSPGSPEVERLRGEERPLQRTPLGRAFLDALPGGSGTPHAISGQASRAREPARLLQVVPDPLGEQLSSPASPGVRTNADLLPLPSPLQPPDASLLPPSTLEDEAECAQEATPVPGPAAGAVGSNTPQLAQTDSDTMIARFLSRMPQVTVARGSCLPRWLASGSSSSSSSSSCGEASPAGLLRSRDGRGAAERRDSWRLSRGSSAVESLLGRPARRRAVQMSNDSELAPAQPVSSPANACGKSSVCPPPASPVDGRLPATTLIRLGALSQQPPAPSTLQGIAELHDSSPAGGSHAAVPAVTFHESAEALPAGGTAIKFVAGDAAHGARVLYDVGEGGQPEYALALLQSIYRLGDEAWMEHRYLLSKEDLLQRPRWVAAARGMRAGELMLSACSYHSPMHLICGDFRLSFPGHALRLGKGSGRGGRGGGRGRGRVQTMQCGAVAQGGVAAAAPAYTCRRGFDTAAGEVVPLWQALEGFLTA